jgi:AmmeMemoRadiSam system protein A
MDASESRARADRDVGLCAIARAAIARHLVGELPEQGSGAALDEGEPHGGVFVTLWSPGHHLRGCIGHITALEPTLREEIASCAVSAATADPRFFPLTPPELDELAIEVSLLGRLEPVGGLADLDPHRFGVVVSQGMRRGVLLPDVEGVDTAAEQLAIAAEKGGIDTSRPIRVSRFEVRKEREPFVTQAAQGLRA